jgi:hypothetical protein
MYYEKIVIICNTKPCTNGFTDFMQICYILAVN